MTPNHAQVSEQIIDNYRCVMQRVAEAAVGCGRAAQDVTVVAITKYVEAEWVRPLYEAGCRDFGEARPQQLWAKAESLADLLDVRWHMIGQLQRNKVARTMQCASYIHSVDSLRLLRSISRQAAESPGTNLLLEVNISGDAAKHGFQPAEILNVCAQINDISHVEVRGLMGMAGLGASEQITRTQFRELRELMASTTNELQDSSAFRDLSMGMSQDYEIAISEGATIVRIGSALFAGCGLR